MRSVGVTEGGISSVRAVFLPLHRFAVPLPRERGGESYSQSSNLPSSGEPISRRLPTGSATLAPEISAPLLP